MYGMAMPRCLFATFVLLCGLAPETRDHALVYLARHANVVEVVVANVFEPPCLIEIEDFAAFDFRGLARFKP